MRRLSGTSILLAVLVALGPWIGDVSPALAKTKPAGHHAATHARAVLSTAGHRRHRRKTSNRSPTRGSRGKPGARGPQGQPGPPGPTGAPGVNGSARAYGLVGGRGIPVALSGTSAYLHNVVVQAGIAGSPPGVYCLSLINGISLSGAIVIVGPAEPPASASPLPGTEVVIPYVTWLSGAPDCASGQLEVRTFTYTTTGGSLNLSPSEYVSFSFVVP
jgi:hypothetical protein